MCRVQNRQTDWFVVAALGVMAATWLSACDITVPSRKLAGGYRLQQFSTSYHIVGSTGAGRDGDVVKGRVERIGWSDNYIVARRLPDSSREALGWFVIDIENNRVNGPLSEEGFIQARKEDRALAAIEILPMQEAWRRLGPEP